MLHFGYFYPDCSPKGSASNEAYRDTLRLRCGSFPVGVAVVLFLLREEYNNEDLNTRCGLRR
jgi:hypothetical protein